MVLWLPTKICSWAKVLVFGAQRSTSETAGRFERTADEVAKTAVEERIAALEMELATLRKTEKLSQHKQQRFKTLAQASPVGIFQTDSEGRNIYVNARVCEMIGTSENDAHNFGWTRYLHPDDKERVVSEWRTAVARKTAFKSEYRFAFSGRTIWVVGEAVPERDAHGNVVSYVGAITDITDRKNAEASLQQSETRFKMALRAGRIVAWEWDAASDRIVRSENAQELFGLSQSDSGFPSKGFLNRLSSPHREELEKNLERASTGQKILQNEFEMVCENGARLWVASLAEVIHGSDGKLERIIGVTRDITLRKRAQESLESARHSLAQTLDALPSHVAILDESGRIISVNSAWKKFADQNGFKSDNYGVGLNYLDVCRDAAGIGAGDANKVAMALKQLLAENRPDFHFEYSCHSATEKRWFVARIGRIQNESSLRLFCSHEEVTEIKISEEALRQSEARFRQLADSMPQIVWAASADGEIDYQNQRFFEQTGLSTDEAKGTNLWRTILHPDDVVDALQRWRKAVDSGTSFEMECRCIDRKNGGHRWHLGRALPVRDSKGEIIRWFGTYTDIEEHKQAEEALETARQLLSRHAANLEKAVGERTAQLELSMKQMESFCYSIAHDLRAPLRAMQGFTTALSDDYGHVLDATGREYSQRIVTSVQRMERLIQDLLNYGKLSHMVISVEPVDLNEAISCTLTGLEHEIHTKKATIRVQGPLPFVRANRGMLDEILRNLISNALKFVAPGTAPVVEIRAEQMRKRVRVYIKDNGIGVEPAYHDRIFGVFEKIHGSASEQATGIGLAIVRKSLERLGGQVGIGSQPGKGSCFWFELPQAEH